MSASPGHQRLSERAAWFDTSSRGRIYATGEDRIRLLHALASNVIEGLEPGQATSTFFLNPQGRIEVFCRVYIQADKVLLDTDAEHRQALIEYLESYIIMDDVSLEDVTETSMAIAVEGPLAGELTVDCEGLLSGASALCGSDGVWILAGADAKSNVVSELESRGIPEATDDETLLARVENHRPVHGVDYTDRNIPHETDLLEFVSLTKGCYVGQEIVERVHSQGQVNRVLRALEVECSSIPEDLAIRREGKEVGRLTSPVLASAQDRMLGFSFLRREAQSGLLEVNGAKALWQEL